MYKNTHPHYGNEPKVLNLSLSILRQTLFWVFCMKLAGAVMASGSGRRFGGDKMSIRIAGRPLLLLSLGSIEMLDYKAVVVRVGDEKAKLVPYGYSVLYNRFPHRGLSASIRLAASWTPYDSDGLVVVLADMPFTRPVVKKLIEAFDEGRYDAVSAGVNGVPATPAVFSRRILHQLYTLEGDVGAREVLRKVNACVVDVDPRLLTDIDRSEDLVKAERVLSELGGLQNLY
jgi:molybdenum cofactor cytidylyltransferase